MIDHAFGGLGLHRIALSVFAFNERAIRSYRSVGFVIEGRAREAIWRDGRWWDEISMSMLDSDWAARRAGGRASPARRRQRHERTGGTRDGRAQPVDGRDPRDGGDEQHRARAPTRPGRTSAS